MELRKGGEEVSSNLTVVDPVINAFFFYRRKDSRSDNVFFESRKKFSLFFSFLGRTHPLRTDKSGE